MPQGMISTYDLVVGVIVNMEDVIALLDPYDVPMTVGGETGGPWLTHGSDVFEKKYEWLDDTLLLPKGTLTGAVLDGVDASWSLAATEANRFGVGDIILAEAEYVRVTAVAANGLDLTVTRGFGGSVAVAHANGIVLTGVGKALPEGSDPGTARSVDRSARYNYTQIFGPEAIQVSATENIIRKYGLRGVREFDYQVGQRLKEEAIKLEHACLYGIRFEDTTNELRTMGGLTQYITSVIDSTTNALTDTKLVDLMQSIFTNGGNPRVIQAGAKQKRTISGFESSILRIASQDGARGHVVDRYITDFGEVAVKLNRNVRTPDLFVYDPEQVELQTLRPFQFEMLAKTGDSMKGQIVGEKTLVVRREKHAGRFSALT